MVESRWWCVEGCGVGGDDDDYGGDLYKLLKDGWFILHFSPSICSGMGGKSCEVCFIIPILILLHHGDLHGHDNGALQDNHFYQKTGQKSLSWKYFSLEPTNYSCCVKYSNILSFFCFFLPLPSSLGPCVWPLQTSTPLSPPTYLNPLENASCQNPHWKYLTHLNFLRRTLRAKRKVWKRNKSHFRWNYPETVTFIKSKVKVKVALVSKSESEKEIELVQQVLFQVKLPSDKDPFQKIASSFTFWCWKCFHHQ